MNVRVNGIAPGIVKTPMVEPMGEEVVEQLCRGMHLTKKAITTDQVQDTRTVNGYFPFFSKSLSARHAITHRERADYRECIPATLADRRR